MMPRFLLPLFAVVLSAVFTYADPGPTEPAAIPGSYLLRMEVFSLPQDLAARGLRQFPASTDLYASVIEALDAGNPDLKLERLTLMTVRNGQRSKLEATEEYPAATQYFPPDHGGLPPANPKTAAPPVPEADFAVEFTPAGWTVETELSASGDGSSIEVNIAPQFVSLSSPGNPPVAGQALTPVFHTAKLATQRRVHPGEPSLLGALPMPGAEIPARTALVFLTAVPVPLSAPVPVPPGDPFQSGNPGSSELLATGTVRLEAFSLPLPDARKAVIGYPVQADLHAALAAGSTGAEKSVILEQFLTLPCRNGQRAKVESTAATPFLTEFSLHPRLPVAAVGGRALLPPPEIETRPTGWTAEVELVISGDRQVVDLNLVPECIRVLPAVPLVGAGLVHAPIFPVQRFAGQVLARPGSPTLVSTFSPPAHTGVPGGNTLDRVWFLFATVTLEE